MRASEKDVSDTRKAKRIPEYRCQKQAISAGGERFCQYIPGGIVDDAIGKKQLERFGFKSAGAAKRVIKDLESLRNNLAHGQDFISNDWPQVIRIAKRMEIMMRETSLVQ
jgi:hypothetical protein